MKPQRFSFKKRLNSFGHAWNGLKILIREEHNFRIHISAAILVISAGLIFQIDNREWIAILFCIGSVISMEILNTAIENIADFIAPQRHDRIKKVKDICSAAVLITAIVSFAIGMMIFIPRIRALIEAG